MQPTVMITNNGTHTPEQWADLSTNEIVALDPASTNELGPKLRLQVLISLTDFYEHVQSAEVAGLDEDGDGVLESPIDGHEHSIEDAVKSVVTCFDGTPFEAHAATPEFNDLVKRVVEHHVTLIQDVERSTWADRNPSERAEAWKKMRTDGGFRVAHTALQTSEV